MVTEFKEHACRQCGDISFSTIKALQRHLKDLHGPKVMCDYCDRQFPASRKENLKRHIAIKHDFEPPVKVPRPDSTPRTHTFPAPTATYPAPPSPSKTDSPVQTATSPASIAPAATQTPCFPSPRESRRWSRFDVARRSSSPYSSPQSPPSSHSTESSACSSPSSTFTDTEGPDVQIGDPADSPPHTQQAAPTFTTSPTPTHIQSPVRTLTTASPRPHIQPPVTAFPTLSTGPNTQTSALTLTGSSTPKQTLHETVVPATTTPAQYRSPYTFTPPPKAISPLATEEYVPEGIPHGHSYLPTPIPNIPFLPKPLPHKYSTTYDQEAFDPRSLFRGAPSEISRTAAGALMRNIKRKAMRSGDLRVHAEVPEHCMAIIKNEEAVLPDGTIYRLKTVWAMEPTETVFPPASDSQ